MTVVRQYNSHQGGVTKYYAGATAIADSSRNFNLSILATHFNQQNPANPEGSGISKEIEWFCKKKYC